MIQPSADRDAVCVLIVDDNRDFAENLADLARLRGLDTAIARDRKSALQLARSRRFDIAILDQKLPDAVGTTLLGELRTLMPDLVALVVTAFVSLDNSLAALHEGAFAFVGKDEDPEELLATIARAAENARLRRENRGLRSAQELILAAIPDLLVLVDEAGTVVSVNQSHPAFCPADPAAAIGRPLSATVAPFVREQIDLEELLAEAREDPAQRERTLELRDADGRALIYELKAVPLEQGRVLMRAVDLTSRLSLERRLTESEHFATLGRLVSSIAHEVRNPLAGIRALAQVLQRRLKDKPDDRENVDEILALTDRMHATLSDLLEFARPTPQRDEPLQLPELIESLVDEARRWEVAEEKSIELVRADPRPFEVVGARHRVVGIFANLLDNALHAAPAKGNVRVRWARDDHSATVEVEDDGPGVPDDVVANLFQPFFTTKTRGTGLGLSIVKKNVSALGGEVAVGRSFELGGARFTVTIPAPRGSHGSNGP